MNRNFTYISFLFLLVIALILPNLNHLIHPDRSAIFIFEEILGVALFGLGCLLFIRPIRKIIDRLNISHSWDQSVNKRIFREIIYVGLATLCVGGLITFATYLYLNKYGVPKPYQEILSQKNQMLRETSTAPGSPFHRPPPPNAKTPQPPPWKENLSDAPIPNKGRKQGFPFDSFVYSIFGGSFILFTLLFTVEEIFDFNEKRNEEKLQKEALLKEQALMQASVLQKQLNPHFMFNTLNVLSGLIHEDVDKSERFIKELSQIYRYTLEHSETIISTLEEEIEYIKSYFFLLKIRFEDKLYYNINIPDSSLKYKIPTLTLEVLVENAIKHNVIAKTSPLNIEIFIANNCLVVKNNLQIHTESVHSHGVGLGNLKKRLELLGVTRASFGQEENFFVARVPLLIEEEKNQ